MASNAQPETRSPSGPQNRRQESAPSRWSRRGLLLAGAVSVLASVATLIAGVMPSQQTGPRLTHTITRGDLLVTVRERGLLESSENTEIKCRVRGFNTVIWVIDSGTVVAPGDELIRLDTLHIEEQIDERSKYAHWSRSAAERSKATVAAAKLAVAEYEQGRYVTQLMRLEKDLAVAESTQRSATSMVAHAEKMADNDYASWLDVEAKEFERDQARLDFELKQCQIDVLKRFTHLEQLQTLEGDLAAAKATHAANVERAMADASRRDRALEEFEYCVVTADRGGLVIHPSAAQWDDAPEIAEGVIVHKDQILLLMPDLSTMRVKVGVHESVVDRLKEGMSAEVTLPNSTLDGVVASVSLVTAPTGWWTGNEVRYDTFVDLPSVQGLRPGASAEVEILIARHEDVLTVPVAAVVESDAGDFCWVNTPKGPRRRTVQLGDSNGVFTVVINGLKEGDNVVLHPLALPDAQALASRGSGRAEPQEAHVKKAGGSPKYLKPQESEKAKSKK